MNQKSAIQENEMVPNLVQKIVARRNASAVPLAEALDLLWNLEQKNGSILKSQAIAALSDFYSECDTQLKGSPRRLAKDRYRHFIQYGYLLVYGESNRQSRLSNKAITLMTRWLPQYNSEKLEDNKIRYLLVRRRVARKKLKLLEHRIARDQEGVEMLTKILQDLERKLIDL